MKRMQIGVVGGRDVSKDILDLAFSVGREIARRDAVLICGGMSGVMESACKGAKEEGGLTVGLLPTNNSADANPFIDILIPTGIGLARNVLVVNAADGIIAIGGRYGTLTEMAFAKQMEKPLVSLKSWEFEDSYPQAQTPREAVKGLFQQLEKK